MRAEVSLAAMRFSRQLWACVLTSIIGVYAPGYEERRAERLMENYGIDVKNPAPAVSSPSPQ